MSSPGNVKHWRGKFQRSGKKSLLKMILESQVGKLKLCTEKFPECNLKVKVYQRHSTFYDVFPSPESHSSGNIKATRSLCLWAFSTKKGSCKHRITTDSYEFKCQRQTVITLKGFSAQLCGILSTQRLDKWIIWPPPFAAWRVRKCWRCLLRAAVTTPWP